MEIRFLLLHRAFVCSSQLSFFLALSMMNKCSFHVCLVNARYMDMHSSSKYTMDRSEWIEWKQNRKIIWLASSISWEML